jgi:hypothetical protein
MQFLCVVLSEQSFDLSMGQAERASVGPPIAAVRLQDNINFGNQLYWKNDKRFVLFISFNVW